MKRQIILLISFLISLVGCQDHKHENQEHDLLQKKYDSLLKLNEERKGSVCYKFSEILSKEKGNLSDTILINDYKILLNKDELYNLYIWDRIHSISSNTNNANVLDEFKGTYILKPNHNKKYAQVTKIQIRNDSTFIYKNDNLIISGKTNILNSSNGNIKGKILVGRYKISLIDFATKKVIFFIDNLCMDCEELQLYKNN